jgi:hypothetical protein
MISALLLSLWQTAVEVALLTHSVAFSKPPSNMRECTVPFSGTAASSVGPRPIYG